MSLIISVNAPEIIIYTMILRFMGQMTHANSKISYGLFRYVLAEPKFHRIHHSVDERHWGKNFAFMFPFWDVISVRPIFQRPTNIQRQGSGILRLRRKIPLLLARNELVAFGFCVIFAG